jgi:tripartite-type tricarboxylate transporter receptor subunit TctC
MKKFGKLILAAALSLPAAYSATAADFPSRAENLVVPFGAGGNTDAVARAFQKDFSDALGGAEIVVRNVSGAAGTIGTAEAAAAKPDGYTLGVIPIGPLTTQPHLRKLPYDKDSWEYVCNLTLNPVLLLVDKNSPFNTIADVKETLSKEPNKYVYGSPGPGTIPHLALAATMGALGVQTKHLPHKGSADVMKSMAGGTIQFAADPALVMSRYDVKALASFTEKRMESLPDLPTMKESGYPMTFSIWVGVVAPKGTPADVVGKLSSACETASKGPNFTAVTSKSGTAIEYMDSAAFGDFVRAEFEKNGKILEEAGLKK